MKQIKSIRLIGSSLVLIFLVLYGCDKSMVDNAGNEFASLKSENNGSPAFAINSYPDLSPTTKWDGNTGFGLWLLHAWVWDYNPAGVFSPMNPTVHLN